jgi:hypothetical protein
MMTPRSSLIRRVTAALDASPSRIPVLVGSGGSGRTTLLAQLRDRAGRQPAQYVNVERVATTPERFHQAIVGASPFPATEPAPSGTRPAFDATLSFLCRARTGGGEPATFLLDEFLELRTFESFPGLRRVLHDLADGLSASANRFVLTSRYVARTLRLLRDRSSRFEVILMPPLTEEDTLDVVAPAAASGALEAEDLARNVRALTDGLPAYTSVLAAELASVPDAVSALVALLGPDGRLTRECGFRYELRLHRARGYGALKAILEILAEEEPLTLTEISHRLRRTPGSTKDYLSWLEDVDLIASRQKRYSFADPLLRVWVRLHCRTTVPTEDEVAREVHRYAMPRLPVQASAPAPEGALALASAGGPSTGIIEID